MSGRFLLLLLLFIAFLYPVQVGDLSVNYSFVALPMLVVMRRGLVKQPPDVFIAAMVLYFAILAIAFLYQVEFAPDGIRRFVSFAIFMTMFAYTIIGIDAGMVGAFKTAVVAISVAFSIRSAVVFVLGGGASIGYAAKDLVGSQRYGFIYLLAFWLVIWRDLPFRLSGLVRFGLLFVLATGLLLTFSRSSVVALLLSGGLAAAASFPAVFRMRPKHLLQGFTALVALVVLVLLLDRFVPLAFEFFGDRLFSFLGNADMVASHLGDASTSEGTRILIWRTIFEHVARNPFTGAGYLGIWIIPAARAGSAHNQFTDVLFRTGVFGLLAYGYLLVRLMRFLYSRERGLFWGFAGILIYGMFHETFKESQGTFVLAFTLGMLAQEIRKGRVGASRNPVKRRVDRPAGLGHSPTPGPA